MQTLSLRFCLAAFLAAACGGAEEPSAAELNAMASAHPSTTANPPVSSPGAVAPEPVAMGPATAPEMAGTGGSTNVAIPPGSPTSTVPSPEATDPPSGGSGPLGDPIVAEPPIISAGGAPPDVGAGGAGSEPPPNGGAFSGEGGSMTGTGGAPPDPVVEPETPYSPRTGSFRMLVYSKVAGFPHADSINTGKVMLQEIADEQGFEASFTDTNEEITPEGLSQYEIVFFLNTTGDIFSNIEQQTYEDWMTTQNGAFAGVHSATDTENGWAFYSEVTGQYYDLHEPCCLLVNIQWDPDALDMVMVQGLPSPWPRSEEWYYFNRNAEWSTKAGFKILSRITSNNSTRPVSYVREWGNFRSFYTSLGHEGSVFQDDLVKRHVAAGIMWAVRREAEFKP